MEGDEDTENFINSIINAKDDDEAFLNLMRGENVIAVGDDGTQQDFHSESLNAHTVKTLW